MLIQLQDGGIKDIHESMSYTAGCPTCDYGATYNNDITIDLTKGCIFAYVENGNGYLFSEAQMMKLFLTNIDIIKLLTEDGFVNWFKIRMQEIAKENRAELSYKYSPIK